MLLGKLGCFSWKMTLTMMLILKRKKKKQPGWMDGLNPFVALSLPLQVSFSVFINTILGERQKGYQVNMDIPVGFKLCKLLTFRYF